MAKHIRLHAVQILDLQIHVLPEAERRPAQQHPQFFGHEDVSRRNEHGRTRADRRSDGRSSSPRKTDFDGHIPAITYIEAAIGDADIPFDRPTTWRIGIGRYAVAALPPPATDTGDATHKLAA